MSEPGVAGWSSVHATALVVGESGLLVRGPSGAGKSSLALALIARARESAIFAALVGDDRVFLRACGGRLLARGAPGFEGLIERRFEGLVVFPHEPQAVARLVVDLVGRGRSGRECPGKARKARNCSASACPASRSTRSRVRSITPMRPSKVLLGCLNADRRIFANFA